MGTTFSSLVGSNVTANETTNVINNISTSNNTNSVNSDDLISLLAQDSRTNLTQGNLTSSNSIFDLSIYYSKYISQENLTKWLSLLSSVAMIAGCVLPYVPQYVTILKSRNSRGFSTYVCLTLLLANILRIGFWFGDPFDPTLLIQSAIMIFAQILLLELCIRVKKENDGPIFIKKSFFSYNYRNFWAWTDLFSYLIFLIIFSLVLGASIYLFSNYPNYVQIVGLISTLIEAMLGLPQLIKNQKNRSVVGMSLGMVFMWLIGDVYKTAYFILKDNPNQFKLCGMLQITIDLLILFQVCLYRQNAPMKVDAQTGETHKEMMTL